MSVITDSYVFNTDTQLKALYQPEPTDVTQIQITYKNTTFSSKSFTIETGRSTGPLETITIPGNTNKTGAVLTIPTNTHVYVSGSGCKVRFDIPNGYCDIVGTIAADYDFESDGVYGVLNAGAYGAQFSLTSDPNYPPQQVTLIIK